MGNRQGRRGRDGEAGDRHALVLSAREAARLDRPAQGSEARAHDRNDG